MFVTAPGMRPMHSPSSAVEHGLEGQVRQLLAKSLQEASSLVQKLRVSVACPALAVRLFVNRAVSASMAG